MGTANGTMNGSDHAREFGPGDWGGARWRGGSRWTPFELAAMVLGFIVYWPIGLAILGYKYWQRKTGAADLQSVASEKWREAKSAMASGPWGANTWTRGGGCGWGRRDMSGWRGFAGPSTGNSAFDDWKRAELARLDEERRKLDEAHREFATYREAVRRAKDKEEFERFMAERRARQAGSGPSGPDA